MFRTLAIGMKGPGVSAMQSRLNAAVSGTPLAIDGIFWSKTERRVKQFQSENQLKVDGIVGPRTWEKLLANRPAPAPQFNAPYCDNTNPDHLDETDDLKAALPAEEPTPVTGGTPKMLLAFSVPSLASLPKLPKLPSLPKLRPLAGSPRGATSPDWPARDRRSKRGHRCGGAPPGRCLCRVSVCDRAREADCTDLEARISEPHRHTTRSSTNWPTCGSRNMPRTQRGTCLTRWRARRWRKPATVS